MAEQIVWNKKLLVASLILGVLAVALFYLYDSIQERRLKGEQTAFLQWRNDLPSGQAITKADIEVVLVSQINQQTYTNALRDDPNDWSLANNGHVNHNVRRGDPVRFSDIMETRTPKPSDSITLGMVGYPVGVDPNYTPQGYLRRGDRIDLVGLVAVKGKTSAYILIQNIRVLDVGGRGEREEDEYSIGGKRYDPGRTVYRSILVELKPRTAEQLTELLPRVQGKVTVMVRRADDTSGSFHGEINPVLIPVLSQPLTIEPPSGGPPGA